MGIGKLWEKLESAKKVANINDYARKHFEEHVTPLRVAVDAPGWVKSSVPTKLLDEWRSMAVKSSKPGAQFHFVFDRFEKPQKGNKIGNAPYKPDLNKLLKELLRNLGIVYHTAPAEAEADCARMEELGIVDAVWSDDGDVFMFGCKRLFRFHKERQGNNSKTHISLFEADTISAINPGFDQSAFIFNAICNNGDYDAGLQNFASEGVFAAVEAGLPATLREASSSEQLSAWRDELIVFLKNSGKWQNVYVPSKFPRVEIVKLYTEPNVSTTERFEKWKDTAIWEKAICEELLWPFLKTHFSILGRGYVGHVVPILLTQALMQPTPNNRILRCKPSIEKCDEEANEATVITLLLSEITSPDVTSLGPDKATKGQDYDADYKEKQSVPKRILRLGCPSIVEEFESHQAKVKLKLTKEKGQQKLSFSKATESEEQKNSPTTLPASGSIHPASTNAKQTLAPLTEKTSSTRSSTRMIRNTGGKRVLGEASSSTMNKRRRIEIPIGCQPINQGPLSASKVLAGSQTNLKIPPSSTLMMSFQRSSGDELFPPISVILARPTSGNRQIGPAKAEGCSQTNASSSGGPTKRRQSRKGNSSDGKGKDILS